MRTYFNNTVHSFVGVDEAMYETTDFFSSLPLGARRKSLPVKESEIKVGGGERESNNIRKAGSRRCCVVVVIAMMIIADKKFNYFKDYRNAPVIRFSNDTGAKARMEVIMSLISFRYITFYMYAHRYIYMSDDRTGTS